MACKMRVRFIRLGSVGIAVTVIVLLSYWDTFFTPYRDLRSGMQLKIAPIDDVTNSTLLKLRNSAAASYFDKLLQNQMPIPIQIQNTNDGNGAPTQVHFYAQEQCWGTRSLTVISGYFNIGAFHKGSQRKTRDDRAYIGWLRGLASLGNPLVFFTDDSRMFSAFLRLRNGSRLLCSRAYLMRRDWLWPWQQLDNMTTALRSRTYLDSPPCTTNAAYDAATNSKYPLTELAILLNPFRTKYFAWLDAGIYRDTPTRQYCVEPLRDLPPDHVGYLEIRRRPVGSAAEIFLKHVDWLAGGVFFGLRLPMLALSREYSRFAQTFLEKQLVGADQQVLAAMFAAYDVRLFGEKPSTSLRLYNPYPTLFDDPWFHLALRMRTRCEFVTN